MQRPLNRFARKIDNLGENIVLLVIITVAVIACIAAISNVRLGRDAAVEVVFTDATENLAPLAAASLLDANFTTNAFRSKVASPAEFAAAFGSTERSVVLATGTDWPAVEARPETKPVPVRVRPPVVSACADTCETFSSHAILPPLRPAAVSTVQVAQPMATAPEPEERGRLSLLGMPLPRFVPSGERIIEAMTSLGGSITDLVLK
ncbi:hypothetical protein [Microvirga puerhi]|uniref:ABC transporter permease n=1 Tax=Microvirga puerhi TaxID=2876078 RepID=A0ABS7VK59_9HYPH|nr:hypothetical protein [Microvirga puerhi]MBZ6075450.1 hypothetical protein [Microvirga puerhi]